MRRDSPLIMFSFCTGEATEVDNTLLLGASTLGLNREEHGEWDWAVAFEDTCVGKEEGRTCHRDGTLGSVVLVFWSGVSGRGLPLSVFHVSNKALNVGCCSSRGDFYCGRFGGCLRHDIPRTTGKDAIETRLDKLVRHGAPCLSAPTPSADTRVGPPRHVTQWVTGTRGGLESHLRGGL